MITGGGQTAKVRNVSRLGSKISILELIAISLDSIEGLERFARRLRLFSSTPTWTRTANGFIRPTSIPSTNRLSSAVRINFRVPDQPDGMAHATIFDNSGKWRGHQTGTGCCGTIGVILDES